MASERDQIDGIVEHVQRVRGEAGIDATAVHMRLRRISHWMETEVRRQLAPQGLEFWELPLLSGLIRHGGTLGVSDLQVIARVTPGAMTQRITKMEGMGTVRRLLSNEDRRQVDVEVTAAGRARFELLIQAVHAAETALLGGVAADDLAELSSSLKRLVLAIEGPESAE